MKSQVTEVKNIMLRNMDTVLERETETVSITPKGADDPQETVSNLHGCWPPGHETTVLLPWGPACSRQRHTGLM